MAAFAVMSCAGLPKDGEQITISRDILKDKVMGGWAGQCIGVTFGGPFEFKYSAPINEKVPIEWNDSSMYKCFPGFDDDLYMDVTFMDVYERLGLEAPQDSLAIAFANAKYKLWHGNQAARYNILNGIMPPLSGSAEFNHHSDDLDFQIESDHCGLMSPGLPEYAAFYAQKDGHIMASGDGLYGGVYFSTMYSLAFISDDLEFVTTEALKAIPEESKYYQAMKDVMAWHKQYPDCWQLTWAMVDKKYGFDTCCPDGTLSPFNIDALINSANVLIGLLYGEKDFEKTMEIALRGGHDTDCNASSAAGILGVMIGYNNIPEKFLRTLNVAADMNFAYTDYSFNRTWEVSLKHALEVVQKSGGKVDDNKVTITYKAPASIPFEQNFTNSRPVLKKWLRMPMSSNPSVKFNGNGIYVTYYLAKDGILKPWSETDGYVAEVAVYLDDEYQKTVKLPVSFHDRALDLFYRHDLPMTDHIVTFKHLNPERGYDVYVDYYINYR